MADLSYVDSYRNLDIDATPELYRIGRGEQGVLLVPWCLEHVIKYWRFKTPDIARESSDYIYRLFEQLLEDNNFPKADLCRKTLMMGWTRARRFANHSSGRKYAADGSVLPQEVDWATNDKAVSASIFKAKYDLARTNSKYLELKAEHKRKHES